MPTQQINFSGINRTVSDYSNTGACEELINLRPTNTGLAPAKGISTVLSNVNYDRIYEHSVGSRINRLAVEIAGSKLYLKLLNESGTPTTLLTVENVYCSIDKVSFSTSGNIIVLSICDDEHELFENDIFRWEVDRYQPLEARLPDIAPSFSFGTPEIKVYKGEKIERTSLQEEVDSTLDVGFNAIETNNKAFAFGPFIVAIAFKLKGGGTFWTGKWFPIDPVPLFIQQFSGSNDYFCLSSASTLYQDFKELIDMNGHAFIVDRHFSGVGYSYQRMAGVPVTMTIPAISGWDNDSSIIEAIEIYASRPVRYVDTSTPVSMKTTGITSIDGYTFCVLPRLMPKDMNIDGQLLYLQKTYYMSELSSDQPYTFHFGGDIQTTDKTLEVDAGMVSRTGKTLSYNSRFHYYNSYRRTFLGKPSFGLPELYQGIDCSFLVRYESETTKDVFYVGQGKMLDFVTRGYNSILLAPSLLITEVIVLNNSSDSNQDNRKYQMRPAAAYNYSYCVDFDNNSSSLTQAEIAEYRAIIQQQGITQYVDEPEDGVINVSEQYSPLVFKPAHSYKIPGVILDVQPQMIAISDITFGHYPLNVFTTKGVFALLQGSGTVLYGGVEPLSALVSISNSAPTEKGTFFLASGELWCIAGRDVILISDALALGPHTFIRDSEGYQSLSHNTAGDTYDISDHESKVPFADYTEDAVIVYNRYKDELIISNPSYQYSYVLSLKYRQWYKTHHSFCQPVVGTNIVQLETYIPGSTRRSVLYLTSSQTFSEGDLFDIILSVNDKTITYYDEVENEEATSRAELARSLALGMDYRMHQDLSEKINFTSVHDTESDDYYVILSLTMDLYNVASIRGTIKLNGAIFSSFSVTPTYNLADFSKESTDNVLVHLQSRPLSFGGYSHIHRIVDLVRCHLSQTGNLHVALYGSDNLQDWKLLCYAHREGDIKFSQLRTPPAARSWRYYTIVIGGIVPADTDFGPVLADVEPVIRRLG